MSVMLIRQFLCSMHIWIRLSCVVPFQIRLQSLTAVAFDKHLLVVLKLIKVKQLSVNMYTLKSRLLWILLVFFFGHRVNHVPTFFSSKAGWWGCLAVWRRSPWAESDQPWQGGL